MDNARYFLNQHPPVFSLVEGDDRLDVGVSDLPWIYLQVDRPEALSYLLENLPPTYRHYAVIEDWMVPIIDPYDDRYRELVCMRYVLPEDQSLPAIGADVSPLDLTDAEIIQAGHAYGAFTDLAYVKTRIKKGNHAGVRVDGELVAWALTHDDGAIGFLYVHPEHRGKGYAADITTSIVRQLRAASLPAYVHVEEDNRASTGLVEKFGFTRDRRIRWFSLPPSLNTVDRILSDAYGHQNWWPAETPFEMMVGAILTQNTAWTNVEKALSNFETTINARYLLDLPVDTLERLIRPSGLYRQKAQRLKRLAAWYLERGNDLDQLKALDGEKLRNELLAIKGIGPETADSILLYALEKPFFVVDAYTRRLLTRLGYELPKGYEGLRRKIEAQFTSVRPDEVGAYGDFHALIIRLAKLHCKATPICAGCPLRSVCRTGEEN